MTKTFDELVLEADLDVFYKQMGNSPQPSVAKAPKLIVVYPDPETAPSRPTNIKFGAKAALDKEMIGHLRDSIETRGGYVELLTQEQHEKEVVVTEAKQEHDMWVNTSGVFGDPLNFPGSPFVMVAGKTSNEELKEAVIVAEKYVDMVVESTVESQSIAKTIEVVEEVFA